MIINVKKSRLLGRRFAPWILALLLAIPALHRAQAEPADAMATMRGFYGALLSTMRSGPQLGPKGRYARLEPVIDQAFDLPYMAQTAIGSTRWAKLSEVQQRQLTDGFKRYVVATYADNFDEYSGEMLNVTGEQSSSDDRIVETQIVKSDGDAVSLGYLMHQDDTGWRIRDVYFAGIISEMTLRRSQFVSVMAFSGIDGLIQMLNRKADGFTTTASTTP